MPSKTVLLVFKHMRNLTVLYGCLVENSEMQLNHGTVPVYLPQINWISEPSLDQFSITQAEMGSENFRKEKLDN